MFRYIISVVLLSTVTLSAEPIQVSVDAEAVIVMNADTGAVLYEKNAREKMLSRECYQNSYSSLHS